MPVENFWQYSESKNTLASSTWRDELWGSRSYWQVRNNLFALLDVLTVIYTLCIGWLWQYSFGWIVALFWNCLIFISNCLFFYMIYLGSLPWLKYVAILPRGTQLLDLPFLIYFCDACGLIFCFLWIMFWWLMIKVLDRFLPTRFAIRYRTIWMEFTHPTEYRYTDQSESGSMPSPVPPGTGWHGWYGSCARQFLFVLSVGISALSTLVTGIVPINEFANLVYQYHQVLVLKCISRHHYNTHSFLFFYYFIKWYHPLQLNLPLRVLVLN